MSLESRRGLDRYEFTPQFAFDLEAVAQRLLEDDEIGLADHYQAVVWFARALGLIAGLVEDLATQAPESEATRCMQDACELLSVTMRHLERE